MVLSQRGGRKGRERGERSRGRVEMGGERDGDCKKGLSRGRKLEKSRGRVGGWEKLTGKTGRADVGLCRTEKRKGERKWNERECGESKHERQLCPVWSGLGFETIFPPLSLFRAYISALTPGRLQALQLSLPPPHATLLSTTPPRSLLPSRLPSQEARQHEWQAGAGGGIWGLLAKRQTGAAPLESLKWQTLKRVGGGRQRKMKTSPRMSRPQSSAHFSSFSFFFYRALPEKRFFLLSSFFWSFLPSSAPAFEDSGSLSATSATSTQGLAAGS